MAQKPAKPFKADTADLAGGLTPTTEEDASHGCINRQLFQKLQEDLACIQSHTFFNDIHNADAAHINAKRKD